MKDAPVRIASIKTISLLKILWLFLIIHVTCLFVAEKAAAALYKTPPQLYLTLAGGNPQLKNL